MGRVFASLCLLVLIKIPPMGGWTMLHPWLPYASRHPVYRAGEKTGRLLQLGPNLSCLPVYLARDCPDGVHATLRSLGPTEVCKPWP